MKASSITQEEKIKNIEKAMDKYNKAIESINPQKYISGLTCIEPKGDLADDVVSMCKTLELPYVYINPLNEDTDKLNIMQGDADAVAESNRTVLRNLFGKQEQFFALIQEITARNTMLLLKKLKGDNIDIMDVARALRDQTTLKKYVDEYEQKYGDNDLVQFYKSEVFGKLKDKFYQFALGLRSQLEDIGGNEFLKRVLIGNSTIDLDKHLAEGGILIVNTCMGALGNLGDTFGEFIIMHLQNAVFRRPGDEWTRPYHYLWIDEAPRYMNPDLERLMAIGGSFRCATHLSIQTNPQMELETKPQLAEIILNNCRTKVVFGGLSSSNAKLFEAEFGATEKRVSQYTYDYRKVLAIPPLLPKGYRTSKENKFRYTYTDIMELKSRDKYAEAIIKYIKKGEVQPPEKIITRINNYKKPLEFVVKEKMEKALNDYKESKQKQQTDDTKPIPIATPKREVSKDNDKDIPYKFIPTFVSAQEQEPILEPEPKPITQDTVTNNPKEKTVISKKPKFKPFNKPKIQSEGAENNKKLSIDEIGNRLQSEAIHVDKNEVNANNNEPAARQNESWW